MKLLMILMCLGLERFLHAGTFLFRFNWFDWYLGKYHQMFGGANSTGRQYLEIILLVMPVALIIGAIYYISCHWMYGAFQVLVGTLTLLYCLGPEELYRQKDAALQDLLPQANQRIFAVLFWFALLGPVAAVIYRMVALATQANVSKTTEVLGILDWLPVRFFSLAFALVGNFVKTFSYWLDHVVTGYTYNRELLENCGRLAQGIEENAPFGLIDRTLIVFIVVVAVFTLGAWL